MNQRTISMIHELCKLERNITIGDLAGQFQISQRTIRNDLNAINRMLSIHGLPEMVLEKGGEIKRLDSFPDILPFISEKDFYEYKLSKEERKKIASALLIASSEFITLSTIAENLFVSRATIINDLDEIKAYVKTGNMEVVSHPNKGLRVNGKESDKRLFLIELANTHPDLAQEDMVTRHISVQAGDRIVIQKILSMQEHIYKSFLTDDSFQKILLYLGIMSNRNQQGEYIEVRKKSNNSKYPMAQDILKYISQYCQINSTEDEVQFLSEMLIMARYIKQKSYNKDTIKIQLITRQFIERISEELAMNLNDDYDFFENLSNHLESVFTKTAPTYPENPVIDEVLEENPDVVTAVNKIIPVIKQYMSREIEKIEIGYIAVHVCAAIERKKNKKVAFHVIVACHGGIGTSRLLLERLKKHFNFRIVDVISTHEAKNLESQAADFIISTVPLKDCKLDYVKVSPLLNDEDYIRVGNKIDTLRNSRHLPSRLEDKEITAKGLLDKITPVIYDTVPDNAYDLMKKLKKVVREYFRQPIEAEAEIFAPYLHHLLPATHIQLDVVCKDWREAVAKSAQKLLQLGYIEACYVEAMIANIEENGPYIVISKGFAVPHEGLEKGSVKVGMNLIRLKNPVNFGDEELDPVEFVCCLSAVDHKTHLKAFFNLVNILKKNDFKQQLHDCKTSEEASLLIEKFEYEVIE